MRWSFLVIVFLLVLFPVSADVLADRMEQFRTTSYQGYPDAFSGKVVRPDGTTTSETESYGAILECNTGDYKLCLDILSYADTYLWHQGKNTFSWFADKNNVNTKGLDSASDGDLALLWASLKAYERSGSAVDLERLERWSAGIAKYDTCHYGDTVIIASGSGIGRANGCAGFNGVYAGYLLLPFLKDLKEYDGTRWQKPYQGAVKESYDLATMNGNTFPNRCAGYDTQTLNNDLCEIHNPPYMDYLDAQRWVFWTGLYCLNPSVDLESTQLCEHLGEATNILPKTTEPVGNEFSTGSQGYALSGGVKGTQQYSSFAGALWLPAVMAFRNDSALLRRKLIQWQPSPFDPFKDALVLISLTLTGEAPNSLMIPSQNPEINFLSANLTDSSQETSVNDEIPSSALAVPELLSPTTTDGSGDNIPSSTPEENISPFLTSLALIGFCAVCLLGMYETARR